MKKIGSGKNPGIVTLNKAFPIEVKIHKGKKLYASQIYVSFFNDGFINFNIFPLNETLEMHWKQ